MNILTSVLITVGNLVPVMHREYIRTSEFLFSQIPKDSGTLSLIFQQRQLTWRL